MSTEAGISEEAMVDADPVEQTLQLPPGSVPQKASNVATSLGPSSEQVQKESVSPKSGKVSPKSVTLSLKERQAEEHHQWAVEHWVKIDRDHDGAITRSELDSEEFRRALRSCLGAARKTVLGQSMGSDYSRTKLNVDQAIDFIRRKADNNADCSIAFEEFESFTRSIRYGSAKSNAELIFALFDLNGDGGIDENEFREIYRYFLGKMPTEKEFQEEWRKLDMYGMQEVSKPVYVRWLQNSTNPIFKRHAPAAIEPSAKNAQGLSPFSKTAQMFPNDDMRTPKVLRTQDAKTPEARSRRRTPVQKMDNAQMALQEQLDLRYGGGFQEKMDRPEWNRRHHLGSWDNEGKPQDQRTYFSRAQSLPELTRFYSTHRGFEKHCSRMRLPEARRKRYVLSQDCKENPVPERDNPGGTMFSSCKSDECKIICACMYVLIITVMPC